MIKHSWILVVGALTACASPTVNEYHSPGGAFVKSVKCSGDPAQCFATASNSCPNGGTYQVISSGSHAGGLIADILPGPVTWYTMSYVCGASDGRMPDFKKTGAEYVLPQQHTVVKQAPTTTNCYSVGSSVTCNTY